MFKFLFKKKEVIKETVFVDVPQWTTAQAESLAVFLRSNDGKIFLKNLKKYHYEIMNWSNDVSGDKYENTKYRACIAHGVKMALDQILRLSQYQETKNKNAKMDESEVNDFIDKRINWSFFKDKK